MSESPTRRSIARYCIVVSSLVFIAGIIAPVHQTRAAQTIRQRALGDSGARFPEGFRAIDAVRILPSGELLLVAARRDDTTAHGLAIRMQLYAVSTTGAVRAVGHWGRGPDEYANAGPLLPAPGDTTWMVEEWPGRLFVITPRGDAAGAVSFPAHVLPESGVGKHSLVFVRTDTAGNFYDTRSPGRAADDPPTTFRDSAMIRSRGSELRPRTDTIAWLYYTTRRTPSSFLGFTALPYGLGDRWAVAPNGDVIIVRAEEYRVDRIPRTGSASRGSPISYERRPVTAGDRKAYIADLRANARGAGFPDPGPGLERAEWPAFKPPFTGEVVFAADAVWVPITRSHEKDPVVYDVVSFAGTLRERVAAPRGTTVIAVGPSAVYGVQRDRGLVYLRRWGWSPE
jgi:hypothetical protein